MTERSWPPPKLELSEMVRRLEQGDAESRETRARRYIEVQQVTNTFPLEAWGDSAGGAETNIFLVEAVRCYQTGLFAAALICAHATCEQEVAGRVRHNRDSAPRGWERWGLGKLIEYSEQQGWYSADTVRLLKETNENRRGVYHLRNMDDPDSLFTRAYKQVPYFDKHEIRQRLYEELQRNALEAIRAAFAVRSDED